MITTREDFRASNLICIFQEAIDNGDILLANNELYVLAAVFPLLDQGLLQPSRHSEDV